ncbi:hypothetical protein M3182_16575 [Mesobacillus maritimus]|uniref:hypothetical protein n=1 Tax=Mesobacillus maritimus TaxID=1643336 RepID=UPI00203D5EBD|nr:hypothetical protein [Mesobacillus maritimus]MCM3587354.1 hypothetical protein [Mesobacillus maritimus]
MYIDLNNIASWASIISLIIGVISILMSTYSIKKVKTFNSNIKIKGNQNKTAGRDYFND